MLIILVLIAAKKFKKKGYTTLFILLDSIWHKETTSGLLEVDKEFFQNQCQPFRGIAV